MAGIHGKYFLVEESQARQTSEEDVVELGFRLCGVEPFSSKSGTSSKSGASSKPKTLDTLFSRLFKPRASLVDGPRASSQAVLAPSFMLRVFAAEETDKDCNAVLPDAWKEVYQSDVMRYVGTATLPALLLLPLPVVVQRGSKFDRPVRFEVWASQASSKKLTPDGLLGVHVTTLGTLLADLGTPKRTAQSAVNNSQWWALTMVDPETKAKIPTLTVDIRVAFPDRLTSVSVPPSRMEVEVREWRLAPLFSGPALRGLVYSPVSKGFQAVVALNDTDGKKSIDHAAKDLGKEALDQPTLIMEFREEMAEMPLNLLIPACYVHQAIGILEKIGNDYVTKTNADMSLMTKIAHSSNGLTSSDLQDPKIVEARSKFEKFAREASAKMLDRIADMTEIERFYRTQWIVVVEGGESAIQEMRHAKSKKLNLMGSGLDARPGDLATMDLLADAQSMVVGGKASPDPLPFRIASSVAPTVGMDDDEEEEDKRDKEAKADFEKVTGVKQSNNSLTTFRPSTSKTDKRLRFLPINMHLQVLTVRETLVKRRLPPKALNTENKAKNFSKVRKSITAAAASLMSSGQKPGLLNNPPSSSTPVAAARVPSSPVRQGTSDSPRDARKLPVLTEDDSLLEMVSISPSGGGGNAEEGPLVMNTRRKGRKSIMATTMGEEGLAMSKTSGARSTRGGSSSRDDDDLAGGEFDEPESCFYDTISAGAPSAHHLSAKAGGLWPMLRDLVKAKDEMKKAKDDGTVNLDKKMDAARKFRESEFAFAERVDCVLPQGVSIVVGAVVARLYVMAAEYSSSVVGGYDEEDDEVAQSIVKHGFLVGWESLLSTHGKELAMLGDLFYTVRYLSSHFELRFETYDFGAEGEFDDEKVNGTLLPEDELQKKRLRALVSDALAIRLFKTSKSIDRKFSQNHDGALPQWFESTPWPGPGGSDDDAIWLVVIRLPSLVADKLPKALRMEIERTSEASTSLFTLPERTVVDYESLEPKPFKLTCLLFTQGINEMQNYANTFGTRALQEEINNYSCIRLVEYCSIRFNARSVAKNSGPTPGLSKEALAKEEERKSQNALAYRQSLVWAAKLKVAVSNQEKTAKSFEILQNSADLVRWLSGIRIASCKSAKDRTAMSLTWEEARILQNVHHVRDIPLADLANLFREHGTRLINVHKNTGVPRYAFNKTQRAFLPESYRPPLNTIGTLFSANVT